MLEDSLPGPPTANVQDRWEHFRDAVNNAAMSTFGKRPASQQIVSKPTQKEMTPAIEAKRDALTAYKAIPVSRTFRFSVLLAVKSSNAPTTVGFSSAP